MTACNTDLGTASTQPSGFYTVFVQRYNSRGRGTKPAKYATNMTWREAAQAVENLRQDETVSWAYSEPMEAERAS